MNDTAGRGSPWWPSAASEVVGVIGDPIRHSRSPALHNAAFRALGLDWVSVAFQVGTDAVDEALLGVRGLGLRGVSVTMPLKDAVAARVDRRTAAAEVLGAVNCVSVESGQLVGHNTDGDGFIGALARGAGLDAAGLRCVVAGAGGAARAIVLALADAGAAEVLVVGRNARHAEAAAALAGAAGRRGNASDAHGADLIVNATPAGMAGTVAAGDLPPIDPASFHAGQVVVDLVYHPRPTRWLTLAAAHGAVVLDGLGMLVHQAAAQVSLWTGRPAPLEAMWRAAQEPASPGV